MLVPSASATADTHYAQPLTFGTEIQVPATVEYRTVVVAVTFPASATGTEAYAAIKGGASAGTIIADMEPFTSATTGAIATMTFVVKGGDSYYVNRSSTSVGSESYSWTDLYPDCAALPCESAAHANSTWESQAHANASWCPLPACAANGDQLVSKSYADSTYEGQPHANHTWESQTHANATWCPTTGCAFSGPISAPQLTVGGPVTANDLTVAGAMTTQTTWDPYVASIVFIAVAIACIFIGAWGLRQRAPLVKVALCGLFVVIAIWAAKESTDGNATPIRWVAVVIVAGMALLLAATAKPTRG